MVSLILTLRRLLKAVIKIIKKPIFKSLATSLVLILISGTVFYYSLEGWSLLDSFYFSFVSLIPTGVNTGLTPVSNISKWFTMVYLIVGVGVMFMTLIQIGLGVVDFEKDESEKRVNQQ